MSFENDVEMYGTQTDSHSQQALRMFENDVEMYGTQTYNRCRLMLSWFENDVEMYGTQTPESVKASVYNHYFE